MTQPLNAPVSLRWTPSGPSEWELVGAELKHARLERGVQGWRAVGPRQIWELQTVGFHRPRVVVRPEGELAEVAHIQADWRGLDTIRFADQTPFEVEETPGGCGLTIRDAARRPVVRVLLDGSSEQPAARVTVEGETAEGPHVLALVVMGWHRLLQARTAPGRPVTLGDRTGSVRGRFG